MACWLALGAVLSSERPWAVVTGASSGIGRSIAIEAASRGYNLVLAARRGKELAQVKRELRSVDAAAEARVNNQTQLAARRAQLLGLAPGARRSL